MKRVDRANPSITVWESETTSEPLIQAPVPSQSSQRPAPQSVPLPIPSRAWLLRHLRDRGLSDALANWLASSLVPIPAHQHQYQHQPQLSATHGGSQLTQGWAGADQHPHQHRHGQGSSPPAAGAGGGGGGPFTWSFDIHCAGAMYMSYR
jgi:hypothetical protein